MEKLLGLRSSSLFTIVSFLGLILFRPQFVDSKAYVKAKETSRNDMPIRVDPLGECRLARTIIGPGDNRLIGVRSHSAAWGHAQRTGRSPEARCASSSG